jgi:murein DD-endopeptidase MepM/ murein hydrolase activator NlpD
MILYLFAILFTLTAYAGADNLPQDQRIPGGIAVIELPFKTAEEVTAHPVNLNQKPVFVAEKDKKWFAIVGIPLQAEGVLHLHLDNTESAASIPFNVSSKKYPEQHITLPNNSRHVNPNEENLARYAREAKEQSAIYQIFSAAPNTWPSIVFPTKGKKGNNFGLRRFFNGEAKNPHLGMDISAIQGQAVYAPADGVIAQTGDYFFNGRTVMIDHGQGFISMLCHLSQIKVEAGQPVKAGDVIGEVGSTGRATGPHLHWTISLNDTRVDPTWVLSPFQE